MSKISELSDGGSLQSTDYLIAVRSGGNVKVQANGAVSGTTGQFSTSLNVDGTVTADGMTVDGTTTLTGDFNVQDSTNYGVEFRGTSPSVDSIALQARFRNDTDAAYWGGANIQFTRDGNWESSITFDTSPDYTNRNGLPRLNIAKNGDISFYEDTGTTPKFFWDASAESLGIGTSTINEKLVLGSADSGSNFLQITNSTTTAANDRGFYVGIDATEAARILNRENTDMVFSTNNDEKMRIDASGNVGVGTVPSYLLHLRKDSNSNSPLLALINDDSGASAACRIFMGADGNNFNIYNYGDGTTNANRTDFLSTAGGSYFTFSPSNSEAMRIDSDGNLLVGTTETDIGYTDSGAGFSVSPDGYIQVARSSTNELLYLNKLDNDGDIVRFSKDGAPVGSIGVYVSDRLYISDNNDCGLQFDATLIRPCDSSGANNDNAIDLGSSGTRFKDLYLSNGVQLANGYLIQSSNVISLINTASSVIRFGTSNSEDMRIDASGNLLVGGTTTADLGTVNELIALRAGHYLQIAQTGTGTNSLAYFYNGNGLVGSISTSGSATAYNTSSDARLKENIADAESASELIDAIQVRSFDWKADGSHQRYGMVAQELMTVAPEAVSGDPDSEEMMGVDYSKLVPMLVKEIQSLRARVAQLEGV